MNGIRCRFCVNELNGACGKKSKGGRPQKIELNKKRNCDLYKEDTMKMIEDSMREKLAAAKSKSIERTKNLFRLATPEELKKGA
jgi:hypothetical protein